jgi:hypothetical protein
VRPPRFFEWLLRRSLPPGAVGDSIRGHLVEELQVSGNTAPSRIRYRARARASVRLRFFQRQSQLRIGGQPLQVLQSWAAREGLRLAL